MDLPVIAVSGTPAECGGAYGRAAAELIVGNVEAYRERFAVQVGLDTSAVRLADSTLLCDPDTLAQLSGIDQTQARVLLFSFEEAGLVLQYLLKNNADFGGLPGTRTPNLVIKSHVLYQLS